MLRLHQTFGAHAGRVREIDQEVVRFGRLPTNDFAFDPHADLDASGNHAEIRKENGRYVLVDVGSRNGTLVDGRPVQRAVLDGGEEIEFGTGGPRVRIEIAASATTGRGAPTAPATPMAPVVAGDPTDPVSAQGPTAFAPALAVAPRPPAAAIPTPAWQPPGAAPFGPPVLAGPAAAPKPPSTPPPPLAPGAVLSPPPLGAPPAVGAPGAPKLYGQRTVDMMIQSAVAAASSSPAPPSFSPSAPRSSSPAPHSSPLASPAPGSRPHDTAYIQRVADEAAGRRSRPMLFALGIALALLGLTLCGVSGIIAVLWARAYGGM